MSYEGAMLGGSLLPHDEFITLMVKLLNEHKKDLFMALDKVLSATTIKQQYKAWDAFETQILKNPTTSLLAITHFYGNNGEQTWNFIDDEANAINDNGVINIKAVKDELKKAYVSDILQSHLSKLFHTVAGEMEADEVYYLFELQRHELLERLNIPRWSDHQYIYQKIIYGNLGAKGNSHFYRGKVADAFLNHLGASHWELLNNFSMGNMVGLEHLKTASVKDEERARGNLNFVKLLMESTNSVGWQTGGDLIVTDSRGVVIANIQLKTSANEGALIGQIRTNKLQEQIKQIKELIEKDNKEIAESFYKMLKTSGHMEKVGDLAINEGYQIAEQKLHNIDFNINIQV